jgi:hypothetical protein
VTVCEATPERALETALDLRSRLGIGRPGESA